MTDKAMAGDRGSPLAEAAARAGVRDGAVLDALAAVPRGAFVPAELAREADTDAALPIPHEQTTTQPSLVGRMIEALALSSEARVLEVGTGHGYQAAVLARLAGHVWTVERWPALAEEARRNLAAAGVGNVTVVAGDGSAGLAEHAPYDAVIVAAAFPEVPTPLAEQVAAGGRLVQPVGPGGGEEVVLFRRTAEGLARERTVVGARFVRLYGGHGHASGEA